MFTDKPQAYRYLAALCKQSGDWKGSTDTHHLILYSDDITDEEFLQQANEIARKRGDSDTPRKQKAEESQEQKEEEARVEASNSQSGKQGEPTRQLRPSRHPKSG